MQLKQNKSIAIILALALLVGVGAYGGIRWYRWSVNRPAIDTQSGRGSMRTQEKIQFHSNGQTLLVNDFLRYPVSVWKDGVTMLVDRLEYGVVYWPKEDVFRLPITLPPVYENSLAAEAEFLKVLGIDRAIACKLRVIITGAEIVDPVFENNDEFALSFCPGRHLEK